MFRAKAWGRRAGITALVLLSLFTGTVALPHAEVDDFACRPVVFSHDETVHVMGAAPGSPTSDADHCFVCHSHRSFYPAFEKFEQRTGAFRTERMYADAFAFADRIDWSLVPGRAPPA